MELFQLNNTDILHHYTLLSHSVHCFDELVKTGKLKDIILQEGNIEQFIKFRHQMRSIKNDPLLVCLAYMYLNSPENEELCDGIVKICRIPTDLFKLMNLIAHGDCVNNNFANGDVGDFYNKFKHNPLRKRKHDGNENNEIPERIWKFIKKHKFIKKWYTSQSAIGLLYLCTKYKNRNSWNHKSILRDGHFKFHGSIMDKVDETNKKPKQKNITDDSNNGEKSQWTGGDCGMVVKYILHGMPGINRHEEYRPLFINNTAGIDEINSRVICAIKDLEKSNTSQNSDEVVELIKNNIRRNVMFEHNISQVDILPNDCEEDFYFALPGGDAIIKPSVDVEKAPFHRAQSIGMPRFHICIEHLPTKFYKSKEIWEAIMEDLPVIALMRNICHMATLGVYETEEHANAMIELLGNLDRLRCIHPFQVLRTIMAYKAQSRSDDDKLYEALCNAFHLSLQRTLCLCDDKINKQTEMKEVRSQKRIKICVEASTSMLKKGFMATKALTAAQTAVAMAIGLRRLCDEATIWICRNEMTPLGEADIHSLLHGIEQDQPYKSDLSKPITGARSNGEVVDAFVLFTKSIVSELTGESPYAAFCKYRESNRNAKLIICAMEVNEKIIADPNDENVKVFCGVDACLINEIISYLNA